MSADLFEHLVHFSVWLLQRASILDLGFLYKALANLELPRMKEMLCNHLGSACLSC